MQNSIKTELKTHVLDLIKDGILTDENQDDWHYHAFNEDYYIIGYHQAKQWLKMHDLDAFDVIRDVIEHETTVFGESHLQPADINSEKIVNLYVYFLGDQLISEADADCISELKEFCESE